MADGYIGTDPARADLLKRDILSGIESGDEVFSSAVADDLDIKLFGNVATVAGKWTAAGKSKGKEWRGVHRFTNTWVRNNERWQVVSDQWAKVQPE